MPNDKNYEEGMDYQYEEQPNDSAGGSADGAEKIEMPAVSRKAAVLRKLKSRKGMGIIIFVIVVIIVYSLLGGGSSSTNNTLQPVKTKTPNMIPSAPMQALPMPAPIAQVQIQKPEESVQPQVEPAHVRAEAIDALADKLAERTRAQTAEQIDTFRASFNARVSTLQDQLLAANTKEANLEETVSQLQSRLDDMQHNYDHLKNTQQILAQGEGYSFNADGELNMGGSATQSQSNDSAMASEESVNLVYTVEAIVPGRAWLRMPNGMTQTVTVGDVIPGYGQVVSVDSMDGVVNTSSGKTITSGD